MLFPSGELHVLGNTCFVVKFFLIRWVASLPPLGIGFRSEASRFCCSIIS